jgi:hypothetical protein
MAGVRDDDDDRFAGNGRQQDQNLDRSDFVQARGMNFNDSTQVSGMICSPLTKLSRN